MEEGLLVMLIIFDIFSIFSFSVLLNNLKCFCDDNDFKNLLSFFSDIGTF